MAVTARSFCDESRLGGAKNELLALAHEINGTTPPTN
jgi:hypothetical protein